MVLELSNAGHLPKFNCWCSGGACLAGLSLLFCSIVAYARQQIKLRTQVALHGMGSARPIREGGKGKLNQCERGA